MGFAIWLQELASGYKMLHCFCKTSQDGWWCDSATYSWILMMTPRHQSSHRQADSLPLWDGEHWAVYSSALSGSSRPRRAAQLILVSDGTCDGGSSVARIGTAQCRPSHTAVRSTQPDRLTSLSDCVWHLLWQGCAKQTEEALPHLPTLTALPCPTQSCMLDWAVYAHLRQWGEEHKPMADPFGSHLSLWEQKIMYVATCSCH